MKLFLIEINNGEEYADYVEQHKLISAKDMIDATIIAIGFMNENYESDNYATPEFYVTEIKEVDGYAIKLQKQ